MHSPAAFSLAGKTAVVTGASRGIGAAIASGLQASGAKVFGLSRSGTAPSHVTAIKCDLADDAAIGSDSRSVAGVVQQLYYRWHKGQTQDARMAMGEAGAEGLVALAWENIQSVG